MYLLYGVAQRWVPLNSRVVAILWDAVEDAVEDADSRPPVAPDLVTFRTVVSSTTRDGFLSFRLPCLEYRASFVLRFFDRYA